MKWGGMGAKKIITAFGATGAQGGGLARSTLADHDGPFAVRAVTRDPVSKAAQAMDCACGAYCVTFFWSHFSHSLNPRLQSFAQWLERNAARIPLA